MAAVLEDGLGGLSQIFLAKSYSARPPYFVAWFPNMVSGLCEMQKALMAHGGERDFD